MYPKKRPTAMEEGSIRPSELSARRLGVSLFHHRFLAIVHRMPLVEKMRSPPGLLSSPWDRESSDCPALHRPGRIDSPGQVCYISLPVHEDSP